jgi:hypothetical protein
VTRPPWLIVIHLPDGMPPGGMPPDDFHRWARHLPDGSTACALGAEAAEAVLAAIPEDVRP